MWMLSTWSASVIGLSTETVSGTVLPFSTSGGMSSLTRPGRTAAPPVTCLMAAASASGVASAGVHGNTVIAAAPARKTRREFMSLLQGRQIRHDILELLCGKESLAGESLGHALQMVQPIIG